LTEVENIFFRVIEDLKDYLEDLTLVGGWLPFLYARYLWNDLAVRAITTVDIDFGFGGKKTKPYSKTIFQVLSSLDYKERHFQMDRMYPVVLYKQGKIPIDFITSPMVAKEIIDKFIGRQIKINKIDKFNFLLNNRIPIIVKHKKAIYEIFCPKPSAFLYHKAAIFIDRENEQKQAKDLYYIYFILRYAPDLEAIFKEISEYEKKGYLNNISKNLNNFFSRESSQGCLLVERENGPDEYISDLREDIFERFGKLRAIFSA
jgi:hypothetical protein